MRLTRIRLLRDAVISTALFLLTAGLAQATTGQASHPMRFDHLSLDDGLSQSNVLSVLQDSDGMMWFGTENGLNRFDGYEFNHYRRERGNPNALSSDFVFDIAEDADGNLWLATNGGGLTMFDRATGKATNYRNDPNNTNSVSSNNIRSLLIDDSGTIWVGTRGAGLDRFDPIAKTFTQVNIAATVGTIFSLHIDSTGFLWVGGDHGLTRFNTESDEAFTYTNDGEDKSSISAHSVRAIFEDSEGQLWIGTFGGGLSLLNQKTSSFQHLVHDANDTTTISGNQVSSIFEDRSGRLWVGTTEGLNLVDKSSGSATRYVADSADRSSLRDGNITTIYQDRSGLMWFGTKWQGVSKWNPRTWYYGHEPAKEITADEKSQPNVMSIIDDGADTLWIGTFGEGLNAVNRQTGEIIRYRDDPNSEFFVNDNRIMSLMRDSHGKIWVGTMANGITRLDPTNGERETFRHDPESDDTLSANGVMRMYEDRAGDVWVGTFGGGISRYNPEANRFTRYATDVNDPYSLSSDRVTSFAEDQGGRLWIGTDSGGLNLFDPKTERFHRFSHDPDDPKTLAADTVYSINIDAKGTVWIGTQGGGLDRVVGGSQSPDDIYFQNTSQLDGLANDVVYGLQFDDAGWIWMSTNYGISRFHPETGQIKNLHRKDGLQSEEFNFGAHHRSESGELFFGGHNGFNAFKPEEIRTSTVVPLMALTGFFNQGDATKSELPEDATDAVEISWKDDSVAFEFAVMDYVDPGQNQYMYKLEGFDRNWVDLGNRRRITYTDLNDGNYLLRVKAANSEGVWNESGVSIPVHVSAAPWDTWWAYLGYVALFAQIVTGLWLGHRRKLRREEEYSHRLELEVNSRTEKLLDKNQQLRVLNQALQESSLSDPLTGLRNRRFVFEEVSRDLDVIQRRLADEREGADKSDTSELVFMMIDLDNFKPINDTYGHAAGDKMLIELRDVLLGICRRSDFVIRWGGDEFVVIAKQASSHEANALAERIRSRIAGHNFSLNDGQIVRTTCSIGFAAYPLFRTQADESGLDQIISLADGLMYEAKKVRNAWVGMHGPNEATTSFEYDHETIESTSLLFRARRAGNLNNFSSEADEGHAPIRLSSAG